eukprot:gene6633-23142_t
MSTVLFYSSAGGPEDSASQKSAVSDGATSTAVPSYGSTRSASSTPLTVGSRVRNGTARHSTSVEDLNASMWIKWRTRLLVACSCGVFLGVLGASAPALINSVISSEVASQFNLADPNESTPGVSAHLTCKEGMFPKGAVKTICLSTGEWSDKLGACTECTLKGCEVCSTEKTCSKCNAESLLLDNGTCGSIPKSCADLYAQGKRKNGIYRLTSGDAKQTYKQHCILEDTDHYTGGWTRFVRVEPGCESLNAFDNDCARGYTKSRTGCWEFDGKIMAQASDKQVMAVGQASSGQDFVEMLTGDRGGMPE